MLLFWKGIPNVIFAPKEQTNFCWVVCFFFLQGTQSLRHWHLNLGFNFDASPEVCDFSSSCLTFWMEEVPYEIKVYLSRSKQSNIFQPLLARWGNSMVSASRMKRLFTGNVTFPVCSQDLQSFYSSLDIYSFLFFQRWLETDAKTEEYQN